MLFLCLERVSEIKLLEKAKQTLTNNIVEIVIIIGLIFLFVGLFMIYEPIAFIGIGIVILLGGWIMLRNQ